MLGKYFQRFAQRSPVRLGALIGAALVAAFSGLVLGSAIWTIWPDITRYKPVTSPVGFLVSMALVFIVVVLPEFMDVVEGHVTLLAIAAIVVGAPRRSCLP